MKYQGENLRRALAAEYVLGTLHGGARRRFVRLLAQDAGLRTEVAYWERRLAPLAVAVAPVAPRDIVWTGIDRRINGKIVARLPERRAMPSINLWRTWAGVATAAAVLLGVALSQQMQFTMQVVMVPKIVKTAAVAAPMPYVAVLAPQKSDARWVVAMYPERKSMKIAASGSYKMDDKHSLELWALEKTGPRPLGLLPREGQAEMPLPEAMAMEGEMTLAVSIEPQGGSPTGKPTGAVILSAPASRAI